jgi:hypothetical protein
MAKQSFPQTVRILSWVADGLLIIFALSIFIAFGSEMSAAMAAVLALSVFLGGLLPLGVHYIDYLQAKLAERSLATSAPETIRESMAKLDKLVRRVEDAATDAARTTLSARQLPTLIGDSTEGFQKAQAELSALFDSLEKLPTAADLENVNRPTEAPPEIDLKPIETYLESLKVELEKALLVREDKWEEIIDKLQDLEERLETVQMEEEPIEVSSTPEDPAEPEDLLEPEELPEPEGLPEPVEPSAVVQPAAPKKTAKKRSKADDAQSVLFSENESTGEATSTAASLIAKAMVGVNNEIFVRGDAPLSWDEGRPLKATGIGEWRLELAGLEGPINAELRLNDELAAKGPPLTLEPGESLSVSPEFPKQET